jgi:hypothetical protein
LDLEHGAGLSFCEAQSHASVEGGTHEAELNATPNTMLVLRPKLLKIPRRVSGLSIEYQDYRCVT